MIAADLMTPPPPVIEPATTLRQAAAALVDARIDQLPVTHAGRIIGVVSEHDLVDFGMARGLDIDRPVLEVMSHYLDWCYTDEDVRDIAARLIDGDLESLVVMTRDHAIAGMISASALAPPSREPLAATQYEARAA